MRDSASGLNFELKVGLESFAEFRDQWLAMAQLHASSFLHFPAWYEEFYGFKSLQPLTVLGRDSNGALQFLAVFHVSEVSKKKLPPIKLLELSYHNEMGVCDVFSPSANVTKWFLLRFLRLKGVRFHLARMRGIAEGSHAYRMWQGQSYGLGKYSHASKYLDLSRGEEAFYSEYSKKYVRNLRRKRNKAEAQGNLRIKLCNEDQAQDGLQAFLDLENSGWKGERGTSIVSQPQQVALYNSLTQQLGGANGLRIYLLYLDDECIAGQFCAFFAGKLSILKIAFNEKYSDISPGDLIIDQIIQASPAQTGINALSFVTGVGWMDRWKPKVEPVYVMYGSGRLVWLAGLIAGLKLKNLISRYKNR